MEYGVLVREALNEQRQQREILRQQVLADLFDALEQLSNHVSFDNAWVFGSVVKPYAFRDDSDVDIAFSQLADRHFFFTIAFLSSQLNRDVDVIQIENAGRIRTKIFKEGIRWMRKDSAN